MAGDFIQSLLGLNFPKNIKGSTGTLHNYQNSQSISQPTTTKSCGNNNNNENPNNNNNKNTNNNNKNTNNIQWRWERVRPPAPPFQYEFNPFRLKYPYSPMTKNTINTNPLLRHQTPPDMFVLVKVIKT